MSIASLTSGISGLKASQTLLNVVANNLANLNTMGSKSVRANFATELVQTMRSAIAPTGGLGGRNPLQIGTGTSISSIDKNFAQGNLDSTGRPFDLAIQGDGFFIVTDGFRDFYMRAGAFAIDRNNELIDAGTGLKVKGTSGANIKVPVNTTLSGKATTVVDMAGNLDAEFDTGAVNQVNTTLTPYIDTSGTAATASTPLNNMNSTINTTDYVIGDKIDIVGTEHNGTSVGKTFNYGAKASGYDGTTLGELRDFISANFGSATASIDGSGNLVVTADAPGQSELTLTISDATGNTGASNFSTFSVTSSGTGDVYITTIPVFDSKGSSFLVTLTFEKIADSKYDLTPTMKPEDGSVTTSLTNINFNANGSFASTTGTPAITITYPDLSTQTISLNFGTPNALTGLTQFGGTSSAAGVDQDGFEEGFFSSVTINQDGKVIALFTNGQTKNVGQIQLATFANAEGLASEGGNLFSQTLASGAAVLKTALSGGVGSIVSGVLEASNVDIAENFTKLIIARISFQANARTITTTDEVLESLMDIVA